MPLGHSARCLNWGKCLGYASLGYLVTDTLNYPRQGLSRCSGSGGSPEGGGKGPLSRFHLGKTSEVSLVITQLSELRDRHRPRQPQETDHPRVFTKPTYPAVLGADRARTSGGQAGSQGQSGGLDVPPQGASRNRSWCPQTLSWEICRSLGNSPPPLSTTWRLSPSCLEARAGSRTDHMSPGTHVGPPLLHKMGRQETDGVWSVDAVVCGLWVL